MKEESSWVVKDDSSFWVYVKPAAHYNCLEWRFKQNPMYLKRCLEYTSKPQAKENKDSKLEGRSVRLDFIEFNMPPRNTFANMDNASVFVAVCEAVTRKEFRPLMVKLIQVPLSNSILTMGLPDQIGPVLFPNIKQSFESLIVLFIIRESHPDISAFRRKNAENITSALTFKTCFGSIPVGSSVYWVAAPMSLKAARSSQLVMQLGVITIASLSTWDGSTSKSCKLLLMVPGPHEENAPKLIVNIQAISNDKDSGPLRAKPLSSAMHYNCREDATGVPAVSKIDIEKCVTFRYVYGGQQLKSIQEITANFGCPLCLIQCTDFTGLKHHLTASHDLLTFTEETNAPPTLWVRCRPGIYDQDGDVSCSVTRSLSSSQDKVFFMSRRGQRNGLLEYERARPRLLQKDSAGQKKAPTVLNRRLATQAKSRGGSKCSSHQKKRTSSCLRARRTFQPHEYIQTFYHSTSALRMTADEAEGNTDTDDKEDELGWELKTRRDMSDRKLSTPEEKSFMFLWSQFLRKHKLGYADYKVPEACYLFTLRNRSYLRKHENRMCFGYHLSTLFNFRLVSAAVISNCLKILEVDSIYEEFRKNYSRNFMTSLQERKAKFPKYETGTPDASADMDRDEDAEMIDDG